MDMLAGPFGSRDNRALQPLRAAAAAAGAALALLVAAGWAGAQTPVSSGYRDFSYGTTAGSTPTGEKPESKLWWNDGAWWGVLYSVGGQAYRIFEFDVSTQAWTDTGTTVDTRPTSKADALWDQGSGRLYVVSQPFTTSAKSASSSQWGRLYRFAYDSARRRYTLDAGFPVSVTRGKEETLTIAKDGTGRLWVTYVESGRVKVNWSGTSDLDWGAPVDLPVSATAISVSSDDISAVIAFGGDSVGVMWSNENAKTTYFAVHRDADPPATWQPIERVLPGPGCSGACADDHINLKTDQDGRVFAAVKTSLTRSTDPLVMLVVRSTGTPATWSSYTVGLERDHHTRPIVVLDEDANRLYVFATSPETTTGAIYVKSSPIDAISFAPGRGDPFIQSASDTTVNNATSTKQNVNAVTGLLVAASDQNTRYYLHGYLGSGAAQVPPAAPADLTASAISAAQVDLSWTDPTTGPGLPSDEDVFAIERSAGGGSFLEISTVPSGVTAFSDTTVSAATTYDYRVRARNGAGVSDYSNTASVTTPSADPPPDDNGGTTIKLMTFENGSLVDPTTGADKVSGAVTVESAAPIHASYSARIPNVDTAYLEENVTPSDDLAVTLYIRLNALPAADARLVMVSDAGTTVGNVMVRTTGTLRLRVGSTTVGGESPALQVGQVYRIKVHQRKGSGGNALLEAFVAAGDAAFGGAFASTAAGTWTTAADRVRVGATSPAALDVAVDDVRVFVPAPPIY